MRAERQEQLLLVFPDGDAFEEEDQAFLKYHEDFEKLLDAYDNG